MGCGCGRNGSRNTNRNNTVTPNITTNRSVSPNQSAPTGVSQQGLGPVTQPRVADRRDIEKIRREAIRRALGR